MGIFSKVGESLGILMPTINVTLDEILNCLEGVLAEVEPAEIKEIEKVLKGCFLASLRVYETKNGKYRIMTVYAGTARSFRLMNEVSVVDLENQKVYTYKVFLFKKKFKKAAMELVNKYKVQ